MQDIAQPAQGWNGDERRKETRKKKPFFIAYTVNEIVFVPAYGLDLSKQGIRILTDVSMPDEFRMRIMFKERDFIVGARKLWEMETPREDKIWQMAGLRFVVIGQNDREFIEAYIAGKQYFEGSKLVEMLEELRKHPDKAEHILPPEV
ncbi:MAG TPA: PilZ domain-containing protein, partial [Candidatus Acidoferrales bacterium]|nr:PilZ domain-containing protein [Candidatus Acidoferrales bacterium]